MVDFSRRIRFDTVCDSVYPSPLGAGHHQYVPIPSITPVSVHSPTYLLPLIICCSRQTRPGLAYLGFCILVEGMYTNVVKSRSSSSSIAFSRALLTFSFLRWLSLWAGVLLCDNSKTVYVLILDLRLAYEACNVFCGIIDGGCQLGVCLQR